MTHEFQVFGSRSSVDLDVIVFVDEIPDKPHIVHRLETKFNTQISEFTKTDKQVNCNLAIIEDGVIRKVFKGTPDEVNNSLLLTYDFHRQFYPNKIEKLVERDVEFKILRTMRVLLSLISRTEYRTVVKLALQQDFHYKVKTLYSCNIRLQTDNSYLNKNVSFSDFIKVYAFQIAQTLALLENIELYTKEDIIEMYPDLAPYINRDTSANLDVLEEYKIKLLDSVKNLKLKQLFEY